MHVEGEGGSGWKREGEGKKEESRTMISYLVASSMRSMVLRGRISRHERSMSRQRVRHFLKTTWGRNDSTRVQRLSWMSRMKYPPPCFIRQSSRYHAVIDSMGVRSPWIRISMQHMISRCFDLCAMASATTSLMARSRGCLSCSSFFSNSSEKSWSQSSFSSSTSGILSPVDLSRAASYSSSGLNRSSSSICFGGGFPILHANSSSVISSRSGVAGRLAGSGSGSASASMPSMRDSTGCSSSETSTPCFRNFFLLRAFTNFLIRSLAIERFKRLRARRSSSVSTGRNVLPTRVLIPTWSSGSCFTITTCSASPRSNRRRLLHSLAKWPVPPQM
eukprot:Sspe_Gene.67843::Locus_40012_Transcript_1_1_Confidence_1.000_Length_1743::g.67843::m.67843